MAVDKKEKQKEETYTFVIANAKGGAAKSTTSLQVVATWSLSKERPVKLYELDDENQDSASFTKSTIEREQVTVGDYSGLTNQLRDLFLGNKTDVVIDIGGNRTTTEFLDALASSYMYKKVDLFIIPITSGSQDVKNAIDTYNKIKDFNIPIIFALSRCRHDIKSNRVHFQYSGFFKAFPKADYFVLQDSDSIDLSRMLKKTVYELAHDSDTKDLLLKELNDAFETDNDEDIRNASVMLEILDESERFYSNNLMPAFEIINNQLSK